MGVRMASQMKASIIVRVLSIRGRLSLMDGFCLMDGLGGAGTEKRAAAAKVRPRSARFRAHGHIVDAMALAARSLGGGGDQPLAGRRRREKFDGGAGRDHGRRRAELQAKAKAVSANVKMIPPWHTPWPFSISWPHGHANRARSQAHIDHLDAERLRRMIARGYSASTDRARASRRPTSAAGSGMIHAQRPLKARLCASR